MNSGENFSSSENALKFFFTKYMEYMMIFLNPLNALILKIPFSCSADFLVLVTSRAQGSVSVGFWGARRFRLFWGGGASQRAISTPPPPPV